MVVFRKIMLIFHVEIQKIRAVDRKVSGDPIRSTIHKLRFTDRTASHWLIKSKMKHLLLGLFTQ